MTLPKIISSYLLYPIVIVLVFLSPLQSVSACGYPGSPGHASVAFTSETIEAGTVATYTCDNGYELLGPPRRTCTENGTWVPQGIPFCGELLLKFRLLVKSVSRSVPHDETHLTLQGLKSIMIIISFISSLYQQSISIPCYTLLYYGNL